MACLPEDVIVEILSRVPVKAIARFRCVSKHWLSLTNDSNFIKLHLHQSIQNNYLNLILVCYSRQQTNNYWRVWSLRIPPPTRMYCLQNTSLHQNLGIEIQTPPFDLSTYGSLAGSCNGLVCLIKHRNVLLVNPTTREYKFLNFDNQYDGGDIHGVVKYGNPLDGDVVYGLGYDSVVDDYKLVQMISYATTLDSKIRVHSLNDSSSCVTISNIPYFVDVQECGVYLDGALHWVGQPTGTFNPLRGRVIVSFDVTEKVIRHFSLPDTVDGNSQLTLGVVVRNSHVTLGVLGGKLCVFFNSNFEIWVMKTYGACGSWYKLASMDKTVFTSQLLRQGSWFSMLPTARPLGFSKCGGILVSCAGKLFLYDPKQNTTRNVEIRGIPEELGITTIATPVASYVSLNSGTYFPV